ncbi:rod shape-determining protein [Undibacterium sp. CY18W]|uniref:Rod shape-determining protein n=1 Tax=Undibacterium hunanense TaxID=2762292 RepID=A0ABR6ZZV3_9BURK|nr:rod shape-determining protein [Undibacterium hunanense]MBC3921135.1 rod shape-determining protein [Undibacterium hunanense]
MFDFIKPTVLYVQISPEQLSVRNVKSGESISEVPELAISAPPDQKILGVGATARSVAASQIGALVVNPFAHPRSLVSDFTAGQQLIKAFVSRLMGGSRLAMSPTIIVHPLGNPDGGFTQIEGRAFRELGMGVGAAKVILWYGDVLTDQEMLSGQFSSNGQVIE